MLRGTPFHARTAPLNQAQHWRRWAGFLAASAYELTHEHEYHAIRSSAALLDVSPLFKYMIRGRDAERFLDRVVTRDVTKCAVGQVMYTPWCSETGKVMDDGTLSRLDGEVFRLTSGEPNFRWLCDVGRGLDVTIEDVSDSLGALALQGPNSRSILQSVCDANLEDLRFFRLVQTRIGGVPVTLSRTGYTGDLGYEIWVDAAHALRLWDTVVAAGEPYGLAPTGILALDVARIEAGLLLIGVDYIPARQALVQSQMSSPLELGLGWTVKLEKSYFVGREALLEEWRRGPAWRLKGLEIEWASLERVYREFKLPPQLPTTAWRTSVPIYANRRQIGYATSGCWSPTLKKYIALAHLRTTHAEPGTLLDIEITAEHRRRRATARVVDLPFFAPPRKRD